MHRNLYYPFQPSNRFTISTPRFLCITGIHVSLPALVSYCMSFKLRDAVDLKKKLTMSTGHDLQRYTHLSAGVCFDGSSDVSPVGFKQAFILPALYLSCLVYFRQCGDYLRFAMVVEFKREMFSRSWRQYVYDTIV
jgi:hypothetical protein